MRFLPALERRQCKAAGDRRRSPRRSTAPWPQREVPLIDVRDLGEAAARLLLSDDTRHIGQFHTINNGQDYPTTNRVSEIMTEVLRRPISHDGSGEAFNAEYGEMFVQRFGRDSEPSTVWVGGLRVPQLDMVAERFRRTIAGP